MIKLTQNRGFTLIEMMITLAIAGIMVAAIYSAYTTQNKTYVMQELVTEMQQNIRVALDRLNTDIRMAGYDPTGGAGTGFSHADVSRLGFTTDISDAAGTATDGDGVVDGAENIDIGFTDAAGVDDDGDGIPDADSDGDGIPDAISIGRQLNLAGGYQPVADNIQAIEFQYLDSAGNVLATPVAAANLDNIREVRMSILARASRPDPDFTNQMTYTPASGNAWDLNGAAAGNAPNDNYRRRLLITTIRCRNMGL